MTPVGLPRRERLALALQRTLAITSTFEAGSHTSCRKTPPLWKRASSGTRPRRTVTAEVTGLKPKEGASTRSR